MLTSMSAPATDAVLVRADRRAARITLNRPGEAQRAHPRTHGRADRHTPPAGRGSGRAGDRHRLRGPGVLRGSRPDRDDRPRRAVLPAPVRCVHRAHGDHPPCATAGHRKGRRDGDGGRLSACRRVRSGGGRRWCTLRHSGCEDRPVCSTPMVPLSRAIVRKRALEMLLTGQPIAADTALDWGLVNRVVTAEALEDEVSTIVDAIVASSPLTVGLGKEAFYAQIELDEHRAYDLTKAVMAMNARADDAQEGMCAFLEKRPATWRNR